MLSSEEISSKWPHFNLPDDWIGIHCPRVGIVHPERTTAMFQARATENRAKVAEIVQDSELIMLTSTTGEIFYARKCIVTVGAWAKRILKQRLNANVCIFLGKKL